MAQFNDSLKKVLALGLALRKQVTLSPLFFRGFTCSANCGACCSKASLDFLAGSERWEEFKKENPEESLKFKQREFFGAIFFTNKQEQNRTDKCCYLDRSTGRCIIYKTRPFFCCFNPIFLIKHGSNNSTLIKQLYSRPWNMKRISGERGALCSMSSYSFEEFTHDIDLLKELNAILYTLDMPTRLPEILDFLYKNQYFVEQGLKPQEPIIFSGLVSKKKNF